jgi:hypothetical protein
MKSILAALVLTCLAPSLAAAADLQRLETVGVVPIRTGAAAGAPRDAAVRAAVARGVERVAEGLLAARGGIPEASGGNPTDLAPGLAPALGSDPFAYAPRFRILRDRGMRDPLLTREAGVEREYVVEAEVTIDATRVRDRLQRAGWLEARPTSQGPRLRIVLDQLHSYDAYAGLRRSLLDDVGVRSAVPVEFSQGRGVLEVDTDLGPSSLVSALNERGSPHLRIVALDQQESELTLLVDWVGPPPGPAKPASDEEDGNPAGAN